jgi:hypothetical protein
MNKLSQPAKWYLAIADIEILLYPVKVMIMRSYGEIQNVDRA